MNCCVSLNLQLYTSVSTMSCLNNNNTVSENSNSGAGGDLSAKITAQGDLVRQLKGDKKPKEEIDTAVKTLLSLKVTQKTNN